MYGVVVRFQFDSENSFIVGTSVLCFTSCVAFVHLILKRFFDIGSIPGVSERDFGSEGIVCRPDVSDIGVYSGFGRIEYTDVFFEKIVRSFVLHPVGESPDTIIALNHFSGSLMLPEKAESHSMNLRR